MPSSLYSTSAAATLQVGTLCIDGRPVGPQALRDAVFRRDEAGRTLSFYTQTGDERNLAPGVAAWASDSQAPTLTTAGRGAEMERRRLRPPRKTQKRFSLLRLLIITKSKAREQDVSVGQTRPLHTMTSVTSPASPDSHRPSSPHSPAQSPAPVFPLCLVVFRAHAHLQQIPRSQEKPHSDQNSTGPFQGPGQAAPVRHVQVGRQSSRQTHPAPRTPAATTPGAAPPSPPLHSATEIQVASK